MNAFKETRIYKTIDFRQLKLQVYLHTSAIISNKNKNEFRNEKKCFLTLIVTHQNSLNPGYDYKFRLRKV